MERIRSDRADPPPPHTHRALAEVAQVDRRVRCYLCDDGLVGSSPDQLAIGEWEWGGGGGSSYGIHRSGIVANQHRHTAYGRHMASEAEGRDGRQWL